MKWRIRKDFRTEKREEEIGKKDNIEIILDNDDLVHLLRRGFTTDTGAAGANITIKLNLKTRG